MSSSRGLWRHGYGTIWRGLGGRRAHTSIAGLMSAGDTFLHGLIFHLERRAVLRPRAAVIVDARGGDVRVAEPFLHLGDVGLVVERVGGGRRAQRVRADLEPELRRIAPHQLVDAIGGDRVSSRPVVLFFTGRNSAPFSSVP